MTIPYEEVFKEFSAEDQQWVKRRAAELIAEEMTLRELRLHRKMTQARLAIKLKIGQEGVSRIERRSDMNISTLNSYVEAVGATLRIEARFPDQPPIVLTEQGRARGRKRAQKKPATGPKSKAKPTRAA
jgi:transcriptional regulator with XRE-family HTH domain